MLTCRIIGLLVAIIALWTLGARANKPPTTTTSGDARAPASQPLVIGESFIIDSAILGEPRPINVFVPTVYGQKIEEPMPVLYMPDGGLDEDFLHIAGLVQVLVCNGGMRPHILVGIPNTNRRRDLTGPTSNEDDKKLAPLAGGAPRFRRFIREELMPAVRSRYATTEESAIIGESLAGLFALDTFFLEPELFDTYIAFDPSLWWNNDELVNNAESRLKAAAMQGKRVFVATSSEPSLADVAARLAKAFAPHESVARFKHVVMDGETHATIYHPSALLALRTVLAPPPPASEPAGQ